MKLALAIAPENALPSAFVVFRDKLEVSLEKAARLMPVTITPMKPP